VEREKAWLYEFYMGDLEDAAKVRGRALRKPDYAGGWQGYEEQAVHDKAQLLARRHFRDTADKIDDLMGRTGAELLIVGGHQETVAEFLPFLPRHVQPRVAGTFVVDPSTMSPGQVRERAEEVVEAYQRDEERRYRPPGRPARRRHRRGGTRGGAMDRLQDALLSRRTLLLGGLALGVPAFVAACSSGGGERTTRRPRATTTSPSTGPAGSLTPTPSCGDNAEATRAQTEGPFFEPDSPEKSNFVGDVGKGTKIVLTGSVLTTACQPVARALLDVWHADSDGEYDNEGFRLRGHFFTDDQGAYRLETIVPGNYSGRTKHFHVKVRPPGGRVLTTQLYFPGERQNEQDSIFQPELLMDVRDSASGKDAAFTFVV
jgi:protocatechuate 3,4-dioxygenase beta subunit